ncbi:MAG: hypothetical protein MZV63_46150 [Marinilabiliales bacterium]|nr:hypothetical protein [Marinilabiliales bacterium]
MAVGGNDNPRKPEGIRGGGASPVDEAEEHDAVDDGPDTVEPAARCIGPFVRTYCRVRARVRRPSQDIDQEDRRPAEMVGEESRQGTARWRGRHRRLRW